MSAVAAPQQQPLVGPNDRLGLTLFLAAAIHGVVILGVSFQSELEQLRFALDLATSPTPVGEWAYRWLGTSFPFGTLGVNLLGCFLLGGLESQVLIEHELEGRVRRLHEIAGARLLLHPIGG